MDVLENADVSVDFSAAVDLDEFLPEVSQRPDAFHMASRLRLLQAATYPSLVAEA